jgi:hypothetical protein
MKKLILTLALFAMAIPALAADATGKWSATIQGPQGDFTLTFNLKAEGETLTGTSGNDFTGDVAISNGKVAGDTITFDVTFDFGGNAATFHYKGEVGADAIEFTRTADGDGPWAGERKLTAKKM